MTLWKSSYEQHNYGELFYALVRVYKPQKVVELGTKAGYSAYHIARGLAANKYGTLDCYDLWEKYPYNSAKQSETENNLQEFSGVITFNRQDVMVGVVDKYESVDMLHIDISHDAEALEEILPQWIHKTNQLIIIEGGSQERDNVEWMKKYNKAPIAPWLKKFCAANHLEYTTIEPFPSLTLIKKE